MVHIPSLNRKISKGRRKTASEKAQRRIARDKFARRRRLRTRGRTIANRRRKI